MNTASWNLGHFPDIELIESGPAHLDKTGDFVHMLQEEEDRLAGILENAVRNGITGTVRIDGRTQVLGQILYDAIDYPDAPDGAEVMNVLIRAARGGDLGAKHLVDKLISIWAKNSAEVSE